MPMAHQRPAKRQETVLPSTPRASPADRAFRRSLDEGERRRLEYLETLDPRQRAASSFPGEQFRFLHLFSGRVTWPF